MIRKKKIGFSVLDMVLLVLVAVCILSTVFHDQIRVFLGAGEEETVEITFLVENVTKEARNHPVSGEEIVLADTKIPLGILVSVSETKGVYASVSDPDNTIEVMTLTCKLQASASSEENGYRVAGTSIKPGVTLSVETPSASFVMVVTMVKPMDNVKNAEEE